MNRNEIFGTAIRPDIPDHYDGLPMCVVADNCLECPLEQCILEGKEVLLAWRRGQRQVRTRALYEAELERLGKSQAAVKAVAEQEGVTPRAVWRRLGLRE